MSRYLIDTPVYTQRAFYRLILCFCIGKERAQFEILDCVAEKLDGPAIDELGKFPEKK